MKENKRNKLITITVMLIVFMLGFFVGYVVRNKEIKELKEDNWCLTYQLDELKRGLRQ